MGHTDSSTGTSVTLVVPPGRQATPPEDKPLPRTGFELVPLLLLAVALMAVGAALLTAVRRRRSAPS